MKNPPSPVIRSAPTQRVAVLAWLAAGVATLAASPTSFEDSFQKDDSVHYALEGGLWTYDAKRRAFGMEKALDRNNETMSAIRKQVALPRAFTLEAEFTADGPGNAGLLLLDPATNYYAFANLGLQKAEGDAWWVVAWIVYSYPETNWGYLRQVKKLIPALADFTFTLQLTRAPESDVLELLVFNSSIGSLETTLAPGAAGEEGNQLLPSWVQTLDSFTQAGLRGYDAKGSWSRIKLTERKK